MIDTVTLAAYRPLHPAVADALRAGNMAAAPGWKFKLTNNGIPFPGAPGDLYLTGHHEGTGLFVHGTTEVLNGWTASLPHVLHGFNGIQIKSDAEIKQAFDEDEAILSQISSPPILAAPFRRLDIAMNISHPDPERLVLALKNARHPWIRRDTGFYANGNVRFRGTEVVFQAYWKQPPQRTVPKRKAWRTSKVLRLEVQLKTGAKIAEFLGAHEAAVDRLPSMAELYLKFREFMLGFPAVEQNDTPCSMPALLALCESNNLKLPGGETVMDWHRRSVGDSGHAKMRAKVAGHASRLLGIDWAQLLPADRIPETVDVHLDGTTTTISSVPLALLIRPSLPRLVGHRPFIRGTN